MEEKERKELQHKVEYAASVICDRFCIYPYIWNKEKLGDLSESEICATCPLNELLNGVTK